MRNRPDSAPSILGCLLVCGLAGGAASAQTTVVNTATTQYASGGGSPQTVQSNPVVTPVSLGAPLALSKSVEPAGSVAPGSPLTFRLLLENPSGLPHADVVVTDRLDPLLGDPGAIASGDLPDLSTPGRTVAATATWDPATRTIRSQVDSLPAGARVELWFTTQVSPAAEEDTTVSNEGWRISASDPTGAPSNRVTVPVVSPALRLSKRVARDRAEVGDLIGYTIEVENISATLELHAARLRDALPEGLTFLEGSARLDGRTIPDPARAGDDLVFDLGTLEIASRRRLSYVAIPTALAEGHDAVNRAWAEALTPAGLPVSAGPASASVRVSGSLVSGEATVVGRVFVDDNRNGVLDPDEPGVPWARVHLEDGTFVLTDVAGKYHIEGLRPGLHVTRIDDRTLPDGLAGIAGPTRSAGTGRTQFLDVGADQLFKTNVATAGWGIAVARLQARALYRRGEDRDQPVVFPPLLCGAVFEPDSARFLPTGREVVEAYAALARERPGRLIELEVHASHHPVEAAGLMQERAARLQSEIRRLVMAAVPSTSDPARLAGSPEPLFPAAEAEADAGAAASRRPDASLAAAPARAATGAAGTGSLEMAGLEERVRLMGPEPAVLSPAEGETLMAERAMVEVKLPVALIPRLTVNGDEVPRDRIAVRMETSLTQVAFCRYAGVAFREGRNSIVLEGVDQWGNVRVWVERIVNRTGPPARLSMRPEDGAAADGRTPLLLHADVRDALGLPVRDGTLVTLESDTGGFLGTDADPKQEGFQAATREGRALARLSPSDRRETRTVRASAGEALAETTLSLAPVMGPWIVAGVGEASTGTLGPSQGRTLEQLLEEDGDPGGRFALFARGPLFGTSLMTLAWDTARERRRDQVFRQLAPDRFFPIYGDSSRQGYEVEGQGKFSLRLDQRRSSMALGDFTTGLGGGELARYDRALTGAAGWLDLQGFSVRSFGARSPQAQVRDELDGTGLSGPYRLTRRPLVVNSERVTLETRDRFRPERVIDARPMSREFDYDVDPEAGTLFFKRAVPYQDEAFHPIVIVVVYEALDGDEEQPVAGGRVAYRFGGAGEIGTTYVNEQRGDGSFVLRGADARMERSLGRTSLQLSGEAAASSAPGGVDAGAAALRAGVRFGSAFKLGASWRRVGAGFQNPSRRGPDDEGTLRWGLDAQGTLRGGGRLLGEVFSQEDDLEDRVRRVASLEWEQAFGRGFTARSGVRGIRSEEPGFEDAQDSRMVTAGLRARLRPGLDAQVARQQVVSGDALSEYPTRTSLGLDWKMTDDMRAFVRQELDESDEGDASRTIVGMESRLLSHLSLESRYSLEDALTGQRGAAQMGLRSRLPLNESWLGDISAERVAVVRGATATGDFTSFGVGFEYLPARVKFTTRYELRLGEIEDQHVLTTGGATRLSDAWSLFTRQRVFLVNPADEGARIDGDGLLGLALRPLRTDRLQVLFKIQGVRGDGVRAAGSPLARSWLGLLETHYEPVSRVHLLGRLALRDQRDRFEGDAFTSRSQLAELRALWDIGSRWNAGTTWRLLRQPEAGSRVMGYGVEAGCMLLPDTWLVGGYNLTGFRETGFGDSERRAAGPFLTVRFKFDESTLIRLHPGTRANHPRSAAPLD